MSRAALLLFTAGEAAGITCTMIVVGRNLVAIASLAICLVLLGLAFREWVKCLS